MGLGTSKRIFPLKIKHKLFNDHKTFSIHSKMRGVNSKYGSF